MLPPQGTAAVNTPAAVPGEQEILLSSLPPGRDQNRLAVGVVIGFVCVYGAVTVWPLSSVQPRRIDAFIPAYATAMIVCDSITAILLFAQFSILRSRATLTIASAYLFTACVLVLWFLTFPGVFGTASLIGGLQSTVWLYVVSHLGFPLFIVRYALTKDREPSTQLWHGSVRRAIGKSVATTGILVAITAAVCLVGEPLLPRLMLDASRLGPLWPYVGFPLALVSVSALVLLWTRRRSMLDLWLMVVMCLYVIEVPLSYYPTPIRFSLGFYTVRILEMVSSSLVLIVLLYEIEALYATLLGAVLAQRRERQARLLTGDAVAATIAHEVRQPLTAMVTSADAGLRFLDRAAPNLDRAKEAFKRIAADGHRAGEVVGSIRAMFKNDVRLTDGLDVNDVIREALALERDNLQAHRILVRVESSTQLPVMQGDRVQLQQVVLNLIANAIHAMAAEDEPRLMCLRSEAHMPAGVMVSVSDTGTGVGAQDVDRIFNPLFTTKSDGMGMGLAICRSIVEAHDGRLWTVPNSPRGAIFHFTLHGSGSSAARA
jgi:signal transduction histidine kinase